MTRLRASPGKQRRLRAEGAEARAARIEALLARAERVRTRRLDQALALAGQARQQAEAARLTALAARAWRLIGDIQLIQARYLDAIASSRRAAALAMREQLPAEAIEALVTQAASLLSLGEKGAALRTYRRAAQLAQRLDAPARIGPLRGVGRVLWALNRKREAAAYYAAALKLAEKHGQRRVAGLLHIGLGNIAWIPDRDERAALRHYDAARSHLRAAGDEVALCSLEGNVGTLHIDRGRLPAARAALAEALRLARATRDWRAALYIRINHADLLAREGRPGPARWLLTRVIAQAARRGETHALNAANESLVELPA